MKRAATEGAAHLVLADGAVPLHSAALTRRLNALGVDLRVNRNGALMGYARRLPPPALGRLLGRAPGTAEQWTRTAGGKWVRYRPPPR